LRSQEKNKAGRAPAFIVEGRLAFQSLSMFPGIPKESGKHRQKNPPVGSGGSRFTLLLLIVVDGGSRHAPKPVYACG
jgi:hypothetical protein